MPVLTHADNGGFDRLDSGIMGGGKRIYDVASDAGPPRPDKTVHGKWSTDQTFPADHARMLLIAKTPEMPLRTRRSFTRATPRSLFGKHQLNGVHS